MRRAIAAVVALLILLVSSFAQPAGRVRMTVTVTVDGLERSYLVVRPAGTAPASLPVLMELHGCCTTPAAELTRSGFLAVTGPAILVYPAGEDERWNAGACCTTGVDDVAFLTAVVNQVLAEQPGADPARVYLAGYSNGGRMAYRMACERPRLFAAVAVFGAVAAQACPAAAPVPLLVAAGTADPELTLSASGVRHVVNGYLEPTVEDEIEKYRTANGCHAPAVTTRAGTLTSTTWTACRSGDPLQLSLYAGGGHDWPAGLAQVVWTFFTTG